MHKSEIAPETLARIKRFRADRHMFPIDPARTAHVVVDLQNGFMEEGAPIEVPVAREIVPNVNRITAALRDAGGAIAYLRFKTDAESLTSWSAFYHLMFEAQHREVMIKSFAPDAHYFQLWPELDVQDSDWILDKTRYSGFVPETCDLYDRLKAAGIDTLIITGTVTNCCCESTARDAMQRDFRVIFVTDGNAAHNDADHNATLANMVVLFADVMSTDEVVARIGASDSVQAAAMQMPEAIGA